MPSAGARVLVTGGAGFIGSHLVDRLCQLGYSVRVLDNFLTGKRENLAASLDDIELIEGDMRSYERVQHAVAGCEVVFHEGALPSVPRSVSDPLASKANNVDATVNVLLCARDAGVRRVLYASSSSVYGASTELPKRIEHAPLPISPYAVSKLAGEGYCRSFAHVYGFETVSLRYFNVFGPRQDPFSQYSAVIPRFIEAILDDESPTIHGDGEQSRDFTYIDNTVQGTLLAADAPVDPGEAFNLACGDRISLNQLLDELNQASGKQIGATHVDPRPGDVRHSLADITPAREKLGYEPVVDVRTGIRRTYEYHLRQRAGEMAAKTRSL
jgi:nucleoside-diphosphate-sugar epimerase